MRIYTSQKVGFIMQKARSKSRMVPPRSRAKGIRLPSGNPLITRTSKSANVVLSLAQQHVLFLVKRNRPVRLNALLSRLGQNSIKQRRYVRWITRCLIKSRHLRYDSGK